MATCSWIHYPNSDLRPLLNVKDFDGDTCSLTFIMSEEGIADVKKLHASREFYIDVTGKSTFSASNPISELVFAELTS